jgi:putative transposase
VEQSHLPIKGTLDKLGISRPRFYRWYGHYRWFGEAGLADRRPGPRQVWNRIPTQVRQKVLAFALERSELSARELAVTNRRTSSYGSERLPDFESLRPNPSPAFAVKKPAILQNEYRVHHCIQICRRDDIGVMMTLRYSICNLHKMTLRFSLYSA